MTTFNTGNPIGSTAVKDLYDNTENLDVLVNDRTKRQHDDRLGVSRKTWHGMERDFTEFMETSSDAFEQFLINSGYQQIGDYGPGLEITARNQVFWKDGELYRAGASLDLPYTTTGAWEGPGGESELFVAVGDQVLRQQLEDDTDPKQGIGMIGGAIKPLKTISDLVAYRNPKTHWVEVLGYYEQGDGGGAMYARVSSEPAHPGKIRSEDGSWWEMMGAEVYIEAFGAKGTYSGNYTVADGHDDSDAIQNALAYISHRQGGKVKTRGRGYRITRTIFYPGNFHFDGCNGKFLLNALGEGSAFLPETFMDYGPNNETRIANIKFSNMTIDTYSGNSWGNLFGVAGAEYVTFERIHSDNIWFHQVDAAGGKHTVIRNCSCRGSTTAPWQADQMASPTAIAGVDADGEPIPCNFDNSTNPAPWARSDGFIVDGCWAMNCSLAAVHLHNHGCRGNRIVNNYFDTNGRGVWSDNGGTVGHTIISGNIILRSSAANLELAASHDGLIISDNVLHQDNTTDESGHRNIYLQSTAFSGNLRGEIVLSGNRITGSRKSVTIGDYSQVSVVGNVFSRSGGGIGIPSSASGQQSWALHIFACETSAVTGNSFKDCVVDASCYLHPFSNNSGAVAYSAAISGNSFSGGLTSVVCRGGGGVSIDGNSVESHREVGFADIALSATRAVITNNNIRSTGSQLGYSLCLYDGSYALVVGNLMSRPASAHMPFYSNASSADLRSNKWEANGVVQIRAVVSGNVSVSDISVISPDSLSKADLATISYNIPSMSQL